MGRTEYVVFGTWGCGSSDLDRYTSAIVLLCGALFSFGLIVFSPEMGLGEWMNIAFEDDKLRMVDWGLELYHHGSVGGHPGRSRTKPDSLYLGSRSVQRYMSVSSEREAAKSIWTQCRPVLFASLLFFALGTALYVFSKTSRHA